MKKQRVTNYICDLSPIQKQNFSIKSIVSQFIDINRSNSLFSANWSRMSSMEVKDTKLNLKQIQLMQKAKNNLRNFLNQDNPIINITPKISKKSIKLSQTNIKRIPKKKVDHQNSLQINEKGKPKLKHAEEEIKNIQISFEEAFIKPDIFRRAFKYNSDKQILLDHDQIGNYKEKSP